MKLVQLKNINKIYKLGHHQSFHVLKDINVSFQKGELVSIIGESGSGKSTMMNLVGGLDSHFEGELLVEGQDIGKSSEKQLDACRKDKIGFVFQNCNLIPHLSIIILVVLYISAVERTKEIGLLRAIGARSKDIRRIFVSEAFLIGISSGVLGLVTAFAISMVVNQGSMQLFDMKLMNITVLYVLVGIGISTLVSMVAGLFPANKAAKLDPIDSLRTE